MWKKYLGLTMSAALVGVVAVSNGCSSSSSPAGGGGDGGGDGNVIVHKEAGGSSSSGGSEAGDDEAGATGYDGTTGKECTSNADCIGDGGPGVNKCSIDIGFTVGALFPTAVCMIPPSSTGNCTMPNDGEVHSCDGPDVSTSPGLCDPTSTGSTTGICYPQCTFKSDGSAATGCVGKDACNPYGFGPDPSNASAAIGVGICFGGCQQDSDCPSGNHCQTNEAICVTTLTTQDPVGQSCMQSATATDACNCFGNSTGGFCASSCVIGGSISCPSGQVCDALLPLTITTTGDASTLTGWTTQNPGMAGVCLPSCSVDGGTSADGGACFPNSTCIATTAAGPDCEP